MNLSHFTYSSDMTAKKMTILCYIGDSSLLHGIPVSIQPRQDLRGKLCSSFCNHKGRRRFPGGSVVKNPLPTQRMRVRSMDQEDPLEKEMATHSSILAWEILWTEQPGGLQSMESQRVGQD